MLRTVPIPEEKRVDDYLESAGQEAVERLHAAADPLKGSRILHVSSTAFGGGVAELLPAQVALLNDLGIDCEWQVLDGSEEFFGVTKLVHNALQGAGIPWSESLESTYLDRLAANAERFETDADFIFVHDPQPLAILTFLEEAGRRTGTWIWRCHIDLSRPMEAVWSFFAVHASRYDVAIYTMDEFVKPGLGPRIAVIAPSIDPTSPKNFWLDPDAVYDIVSPYGVDRQRPLVTQVSRFDPWKDPLGVIDAYRAAKGEVPGLQLALIGSMAHDDPEAWHYLELVDEHRAGDTDIHVLTNLQGVGPVMVNAFQRLSGAVIQKSLREGFGLTASEAMWKERPVIAGDAGGLRLQVVEGETGFVVDSIDRCAERILTLIRDDDLRAAMGRTGRERVRERFLVLREITDYLQLLSSL